MSANTIWAIALAIGFGAAVAVAILLTMLQSAIDDIQASVYGLLGVAGQVGAQTSNIPQLRHTAPVLSQIVDEAVVLDGYMNALTDGYGGVPA